MKAIIKVGRSSAGNDVVINDPNVSGFHCQFRVDVSGNCYVTDLNSTNGTFVNGVRRSNEISLNQSDIVRIGNTTLPWQTYISTASVPVNIPERIINDNRIKPDGLLVRSILTTILCFLPFGIVSILYASKVDGLFVIFMILGIVLGIVSIVNASKADGLWQANDPNGATNAASKAKIWFWWSFGVGLGFWLLWFIYFLVERPLIFGRYF